jgi:hypothetical protein
MVHAEMSPSDAVHKIISKAEVTVRNALFRPTAMQGDKARWVVVAAALAACSCAGRCPTAASVADAAGDALVCRVVQDVATRPAVDDHAGHRRVARQ